MAKYIHDVMIVATLNRVFMAYFQNIAESFNVDFYNTRPTESITKSMIGNYFVPDVDYAYMREFYIGRMHIENITLEKFRNCRVDEWLDEEVKNKLHAIAKEFSYISEKYPYSDYIFSMLPDAVPFISSCDRDCETNFTARSTFGHNIMQNTGAIIFEFYCLIVQRWRQVESEPPYGEKYQTVESMTPEQREKFDKQPKKDDEDGMD